MRKISYRGNNTILSNQGLKYRINVRSDEDRLHNLSILANYLLWAQQYHLWPVVVPAFIDAEWPSESSEINEAIHGIGEFLTSIEDPILWDFGTFFSIREDFNKNKIDSLLNIQKVSSRFGIKPWVLCNVGGVTLPKEQLSEKLLVALSTLPIDIQQGLSFTNDGFSSGFSVMGLAELLKNTASSIMPDLYSHSYHNAETTEKEALELSRISNRDGRFFVILSSDARTEGITVFIRMNRSHLLNREIPDDWNLIIETKAPEAAALDVKMRLNQQ